MRILIVLALLIVACPAREEDSPSDDAFMKSCLRLEDQGVDQVALETCTTALKFRNALKSGDKLGLAKLFSFPISREYPLAEINTPDEFVENWEDYFEAGAILELLSDNDNFLYSGGCRYSTECVQVGDLDIRIDSGIITVGTPSTPKYIERLEAAKKNEMAELHPVARGYRSVGMICDTPSKHIRIQDHHPEGYKYFAWKKGAALSSEPEIFLTGIITYESGRWARYTYIFKNEVYSYELGPVWQIGCMCEDDNFGNPYLTVFKSGKEISKQSCELSR